MIYWPSDEKQGANNSLDRVKQCDLLILILAHRYGYIPEGSQYSVIELEYRCARESQIPILAFFVDETAPWPPQDVEYDQRAKLKLFKQTVEADLTRTLFRSPEILAAHVTQSLAGFIRRYTSPADARKRLPLKTVPIDPVAKLQAEPNAVIQIGNAEDDLPFLFNINRSAPTSTLSKLENLRIQETSHSLMERLHPAIDKLLSEYASILASDRVFPVQMTNGTTQRLYVSTFQLSKYFQSLLSRMIKRAGPDVSDMRPPSKTTTSSKGAGGAMPPTTFTKFSMPANRARPKLIESVGGKNRFLGISLTTGSVYSVGIKPQSEEWVEWHPFHFESIMAHFPAARVKFLYSNRTAFAGSLTEYNSAMSEFVLRERCLPDSTIFSVSRQGIGQAIVRILGALMAQHSKGIIHGDLKPENIVLTKDSPVLIDSFDLSEGDMPPGWTPGWAAPEQFLSEGISFATDVYPLGVMLAQLLSGRIVGQIQKYKIPPLPSGVEEFNLLYNPSIYVQRDGNVVTSIDGIREWRILVEKCLRFNPSERPSPELLQTELHRTLEKFELSGNVEITLNHNLMAATLLDGRDSVARCIATQDVFNLLGVQHLAF